jgi:hypothetical protein
MSTIKVTTKTSDEIDAAFAAVAKDMKPFQKARRLTQADRLAPYRKAIMKQRRRGLTWKQIVAIMADPRVGENVSERLLIAVFGTPKSAGSSPLVLLNSIPPAPAVVSAKPPRQRLILDPLTGEQISPRPTVR